MMQHLTKRFLLIEMVLTLAAAVVARAAPPLGREAQLEALKAQFPSHVAGPVTSTTDPLIRKCWFWYRDRVGSLTMENLPDRVGELRVQLDIDIDVPDQYQTGKNVKHSTSSHAAQQNLAWLKQKMLPYLKRLEQFQRGR